LPLDDNNILQVDATVIAGALIFLTITSPLFNLKELLPSLNHANFHLIQNQITALYTQVGELNQKIDVLARIGIAAIVIALFGGSGICILIANMQSTATSTTTRGRLREGFYKAAKILMIIGFVYLIGAMIVLMVVSAILPLFPP
jgi:Na+/proline symporter